MNKKLMLVGIFCLVSLFTFVQARFGFAAAAQKDGHDFSMPRQQSEPTATPTTGTSPLPTPINTPIPAPTNLPPTGADLTQLVEHTAAGNEAALANEGFAYGEQETGSQPQASYLASGSLLYPVRLAAAAIGLDTQVKPLGWRQVVEDNQDVSIWQMVENAAGWHLNSVVPGQLGNAVISGHNNIGGSIFRNLHRLQPGDAITVWTNEGAELTYTVDNVQIVKEKYASAAQREANAQAISATSDERLTLITCWPAYSNTHRVIVVAHPAQ